MRPALARAWFLLLDVRPVEQHATEALQLAEQLQRSDLAADAIAWLARCRQANGDLGAAIEMDRMAMARARCGDGRPHARATHVVSCRPIDGGDPTRRRGGGCCTVVGDTTFTMYALAHVGLNMRGRALRGGVEGLPQFEASAGSMALFHARSCHGDGGWASLDRAWT